MRPRLPRQRQIASVMKSDIGAFPKSFRCLDRTSPAYRPATYTLAVALEPLLEVPIAPGEGEIARRRANI